MQNIQEWIWGTGRCGVRVLWGIRDSDPGAPTGKEAQKGIREAVRDRVSRGLQWKVLNAAGNWLGCVYV